MQIQKSKLFSLSDTPHRFQRAQHLKRSFLRWRTWQRHSEKKLCKDMTNSLESSTSSTSETAGSASSGSLKLGIVAAASVLAGGLAAAWWYRKALLQLRQADEKPSDSHYGIHGDDPADEG
jgi:hypothetical protein